MQRNKIALICFLISVWWLVSNVLCPLLVSPDNVKLGEQGKVAQLDNEIHYSDVNLYSKLFYLIGDIQCHQKSSRSFFINGNQLPFCSRDMGIFAGTTVSFALLTLITPALPIWLIGYAFLPIGVDAVVQMVTVYESTNALRFVTGFLAGFAVAYIFVRLVNELMQLTTVKKSAITNLRNRKCS